MKKILNLFDKVKLSNYIKDKIFIVFQFLKDLLSSNLFLESENRVNRADFLKTIKKLKIKKINIPFVRIGSLNDGGYLVPDCLEDCKYLFSPGVGQVSNFELGFLNLGAEREVFLLDRIEFVDLNKNLIDKRLFTNFENKWLGANKDDKTVTLDDWIDSKEAILKGDKNLILQMDIEGHEYTSILSLSKKNLLRFKILIFEFHYLNYLNNRLFNILFNAVIDKILEHFILIHLHPNNSRSTIDIHGIKIPKFLEATFIRKNSCRMIDGKIELPHALDRANLPYRKNARLDHFFYKI